jgi:hypothetical protein
MPGGIYRHSRWAYTGALAQASGAATAAYYSFHLDQLPNYTEFTALYNLYRLDKVVIKFIPTITAMTMQATDQVMQNSVVLIAEDHVRDSAVETTTAGRDRLLEHQGVHFLTTVREPFSLTLHPRVISTDEGVQLMANNWIATAAPAVVHRGALVWMDQNYVDTARVILEVYTQYFFSFKRVL